jgi:hypothetical protein
MQCGGLSAARIANLVVLGAAVGAISGCAPSTRMLVEPTPEALAGKARGVAVVKFSMPNEACLQQMLIIGTRDGNGHRVVARLQAAGSAPTTTANAAEVQLEAGAYEVLGYRCHRTRSAIAVGTEGGPYTASLGRFTIGAGEVVNIGHITLKRTWGSNEITMDVADWGLPDLTRYRDERPKLFAGMRTRLLVVNVGKPLTAEQKGDICEGLAEMKATGKVQTLPKGCS